MKEAQLAYQLRVLFEQKITSYYLDSFKGMFGKVQVEVLVYLYDNAGARVQKLAEKLNIPKQHASKIVARLEELGLVVGNPDESDRRATLYYLTEQGLELMNRHMEDSNRNFEEMLKCLTEKEKEQMTHSMKTMIALLKKM